MDVALRATEEGVVIPVRAQPRAGRSTLTGVSPTGALLIRVGAPPVDGAANDELVRFLAREVLQVPVSRVRILRGAASRDKVVAVAGLTIDEVRARLVSRRAGGAH